MNDLRDWLKDGDPVVNESPLSDADAQRIRRLVVAAGEGRQSSFAGWARGSWAAASVVLGFTIVFGVSRWWTPGDEAPGDATVGARSAARSAASTRRQVQLIAPGGTRVIWIFNDDFKQ